eukprot:126867_1
MTTMLPNAIKFRSLSDQLIQQEFKQLLNKMVDSNRKHLITTSLFNYFTKHNNDNSDDLNDINSMLSNIIQSRKQKPKPPSKTNLKLNQLPHSIIGHTASFLDQCEYFKFEKTNRSIFIGCNLPNTLSILRLHVDNYSTINLSKYRHVKKLHLYLPLFHQLTLPNNGQCIMPDLTELVFDGKKKNDFNIEAFMQSNFFNVENIKLLRLARFGNVESE